MKINKYLPFALIYFFVNSLALPFGLTYMAILSPLLYWWTIASGRKEILLPFFAGLAPFFIMHLIYTVDTKSYIVSLINYTTVYIFCQAFYTFLQKCNNPETIFKKILVINFIFCLISIPIYFSPFQEILWMPNTVIDGIARFTRVKLFTYEASYYAVLFTPFFAYYLVQLVLKQNKINSWLLLAMLFLPYILSFSVGVICSLLFAVLITYMLYFRILTRKKRMLTLITLLFAMSVPVLLITFLFFPHNTIFLRLADIISGNDTSGRGRTVDAFILASQILQQKSTAWGVGPGQIKIVGGDIIRTYYLYPLDYNNIAIPNAVAETFAIFGWIGLVLRISIELFFCFYTRVWTNYYRLILFLFIFLYQFTGSFITNIVEYSIWILAFTNVFPAFNISKKQPAPNHLYQTIMA